MTTKETIQFAFNSNRSAVCKYLAPLILLLLILPGHEAHAQTCAVDLGGSCISILSCEGDGQYALESTDCNMGVGEVCCVDNQACSHPDGAGGICTLAGDCEGTDKRLSTSDSCAGPLLCCTDAPPIPDVPLTVEISATPTSVPHGGDVTVSWIASAAASHCDAGPLFSSTATNHIQTISNLTVAGTHVFTVTCYALAFDVDPVTEHVSISVSPPAGTPPPITPDPTANFLGLVPCGDGNIICTPCHLVELAQRIMNFFVFVVVIVAALLFVNAGVLYLFSPASPANIARAHRIFINTLIGLIIILASFLFIDTMMKIFYGDRAPGDLWGPWNNIICEGVEIAGPEPAPPAPGTAPGPISPPPPRPTAGDVRINLAESGVGVNKVECPEGMRYQDVRGGCTSVECLDPVSVSKIVAMRDACGPACEFVVTGGCELGHAAGTNSCSHGGGDKWDLRTTGATNALVTNSNNSGYFRPGTFRGRNKPDYSFISDELGIFCVREDMNTSNDHWDCVRTNC